MNNCVGSAAIAILVVGSQMELDGALETLFDNRHEMDPRVT